MTDPDTAARRASAPSEPGAAVARLGLLALAWPIFIEQGLRVLIETVDTLMVSHVSDDAVAALGLAGQVVFLAIVLFSFVGMGASW